MQLSVVRYRNGVDSYFNVITAQNAFLSGRQAELQLELQQLVATVTLVDNHGTRVPAESAAADARFRTR